MDSFIIKRRKPFRERLGELTKTNEESGQVTRPEWDRMRSGGLVGGKSCAGLKRFGIRDATTEVAPGSGGGGGEPKSNRELWLRDVAWRARGGFVSDLRMLECSNAQNTQIQSQQEREYRLYRWTRIFHLSGGGVKKELLGGGWAVQKDLVRYRLL